MFLQDDSESPKSSKKSATNFLLLVNTFSPLYDSTKVTEVRKITFFQSMKHNISVSAFVAFLKGNLIRV